MADRLTQVAAGAAEPPRLVLLKRNRWLLRRLKRLAPLLALIGLCLIISLLNRRFLELNNIIRVANSAAIPLVLALGANSVILLGSIDLSVEGGVALGAVITGLLVRNDFNRNAIGWWSLVPALLAGGSLGLLNGLLHVTLRIPSFMVTLGTWFVGLGLATLLLGGSSVHVTDPAIRGLALTRLLNFPLTVWVALLVLVLCWIIERFTRLGRYIFAVGGGEDLAALSGVPIRAVKIFAFTLAGLLYGVGGVLSAAQLGQGNALIGSGRLFSTVTAVVVGGTALTGGEGGVLNAFLGVLIIAVLGNGMILLGISPDLQQAVQGLLIIIAVAVSIDRARLQIAK